MINALDMSTVGAIIALVNLAKESGFPTKYCPVLALVFGVAAGVFLVHPNDLHQGVLDGLALGLSAVGLFSGVKNVKEGVSELLKKPDQQAAEQSKQHQ